MQYQISNITTPLDKNGNVFVQYVVTKVGATNDRGFKLSDFNPATLAEINRQKENEEQLHLEMPGEMDEVYVDFGAVYFHKRSDANGNVSNEIDKDERGNPKVFRGSKVRVRYAYKREKAFYRSGDKMGCPIMEDIWVDGIRQTKQLERLVFDESGQPVKEYYEGWTKEERRDQVLQAFFVKAPESYQKRVTPEPPADEGPIPENPPVSTNPPVNTNPPANTINMNTGGSVPDPMNM